MCELNDVVGDREYGSTQIAPRAFQGWSGQEGLYAPQLAAPTHRPGVFVVLSLGYWIVAPFAGDRVGSAEQSPIEDESAADPGAKNNPKDAGSISPGAVAGFGERKAVGIVCELDRPLQRRFQIVVEPPANEPG